MEQIISDPEPKKFRCLELEPEMEPDIQVSAPRPWTKLHCILKEYFWEMFLWIEIAWKAAYLGFVVVISIFVAVAGSEGRGVNDPRG